MTTALEHFATSPYFTAVVGICVGLVQLFVGYRVFKLTLAVAGFIGGALLVISAVSVHATTQATVLLAGLAGGFVGALLLPALYFFGVFLAGAFLGGVVGLTFGGMVSPLVGEVLALVLAFLLGVVAVRAQKLMIVLATAFGGAWVVLTFATAWPTAGGRPEPWEERWLLPGLALWLLFGLIGSAVQYHSTQRPRAGSALRPKQRTRPRQPQNPPVEAQ